MKWMVLGGKDQELRFQCLSEFLNNLGVKNELEFSHPEPSDFFLELERTVKRVDQIRLQTPFGERAKEFQNRSTDFVTLLGSADSLIKKSNGSWWPENFLYEAFSREFLGHVRQLDLNSHVFIVGSGAAAQVLAGALIKMGFSRFYFTDRFEERAKISVEKMKRKYFNISFEFISSVNLMLLPGSSSVLINATPLVPDNSVLKDLYYFNFLKLPATIVDLSLIPPETPLIEEARKVGASVICGYEIAARVDTLWVKSVLNLDIDCLAYKNYLKSGLSAVPFDPKPYKLS